MGSFCFHPGRSCSFQLFERQGDISNAFRMQNTYPTSHQGHCHVRTDAGCHWRANNAFLGGGNPKNLRYQSTRTHAIFLKIRIDLKDSQQRTGVKTLSAFAKVAWQGLALLSCSTAHLSAHTPFPSAFFLLSWFKTVSKCYCWHQMFLRSYFMLENACRQLILSPQGSISASEPVKSFDQRRPLFIPSWIPLCVRKHIIKGTVASKIH